MGMAYSFRGIVHYLYGSVPVGMVLEKGLRILHFDPQATEAVLLMEVVRLFLAT